MKSDFRHSASVEENPEIYIEKLETYIRKSKTSAGQQMKIVRITLAGQAKKWLLRQSSNMGYEMFLEKFEEEYNGIAALCELTTQLYGENQGSASQF